MRGGTHGTLRDLEFDQCIIKQDGEVLGDESSKLDAPSVCSQLHSCSQFCHLVSFGICALA